MAKRYALAVLGFAFVALLTTIVVSWARSGNAPAATTTATAAAKKKKKPVLHPSVARKVATGSFTFVAGGDIAMSGAGADDSTFAGISRFLHGDIVFGNLEGTLATGGTPKCSPYGVDGCFTFRADPSSVGALKRAGFTVMNLANNHALDYGPDAQAQTIATLKSVHLAYDGLPGQITLLDAGGIRVALIGCAPYPWAQSLLEHRRDRRARAEGPRRGRRRPRLHARRAPRAAPPITFPRATRRSSARIAAMSVPSRTR